MQTRSMLVLLLLTAACGDKPNTLLDPTTAEYVLVALSSQHASGVVGQSAEAVRVRILDTSGQPATNIRIAFSITLGDGFVTQADTVSDANGEARAQWVVGTRVGMHELSVYLGPTSKLQFTVTARAGEPAAILSLGDYSLQVGFPGDRLLPPTVMVVDPFGNGVPGIVLKAMVTAGDSWVGGEAELRTSDCCPGGTLRLPMWILGRERENRIVMVLPDVDSVAFSAFAIDTATAVEYRAVEEYDDSWGWVQLALTLDGEHFVEESRFRDTGVKTARFAGSYTSSGGTVVLNGCSIENEHSFCYAKTGQIYGDTIIIGTVRYGNTRSSTPPPAVPGFPQPLKAGRIFEGVDSPYHAGHRSPLASRYVLYDDGTFALQYASANYPFFEYVGTYTEADSLLLFAWKDWDGATATLTSDGFYVRYNIIMSLSDFADGLYVRQTEGQSARERPGLPVLQAFPSPTSKPGFESPAPSETAAISRATSTVRRYSP